MLAKQKCHFRENFFVSIAYFFSRETNTPKPKINKKQIYENQQSNWVESDLVFSLISPSNGNDKAKRKNTIDAQEPYRNV